jgi:voltage-gated potassium channel
MRALHYLRLIGIALAALIVIGATGFHFIEGWPWFDGFYMAVTTFTTIGYQEIHPLSHTGRIFNLALIVTGVSLVFLGIGALTQALLEFELSNFFGRRKMEREIARLSEHYIICGAGRVGLGTARELAGRPAAFVVVDQTEAKLARCEAGWLTFVGDATQEQTLRQVNIQQARGLVAATTTDATNVYIALTARGLNSKLKIIARASEEAAEKHLLKAGADLVVSPYASAGRRIAQSFLQPHVLSLFDTATTQLGMDLEIGEVGIHAGSQLADKTIGAAQIRREAGVIVLAIKRQQEMLFNPSSEDQIISGDFLIAMGQPAQLRRLEQMASA